MSRKRRAADDGRSRMRRLGGALSLLLAGGLLVGGAGACAGDPVENGEACTRDEDCGEGRRCTAAGECRVASACTDRSDCGECETCTDGACAPVEGCVPGGAHGIRVVGTTTGTPEHASSSPSFRLRGIVTPVPELPESPSFRLAPPVD